MSLTPEEERNNNLALYPWLTREYTRMNITLPCPICANPLEVEVFTYEDQDGDPDTPYTKSYTALDDYTVDWQSHDETYSHNTVPQCQTLFNEISQQTLAKFERYLLGSE